MKGLSQVVLMLFSMFFIQGISFAENFHAIINGNQQGPFSLQQLQDMTNEGSFTQDTMVWKNGMSGWEKAEGQNELQSIWAGSAATPPPPPLPQASVPPAPPTPTGSVPEDSISQNDVDEHNSMSDPKTVQTASDDMDDWFDTVLERFNMVEGENNGKFIITASQSVSVKTIDPQYGDALVNAFDKATMKLQEKYVKIRFGKIMTDKAKSMFMDRSTHANEIALPAPQDPDYLDKALNIFEKGLDVAEKKLDQQLIELGTDPQELTQLSPIKKKDLFRNKFIKNNLEQASGSVAGLFPLQTNVITDSRGSTVVGIVAIASDKTIQIAKDITSQRKSIIQGKGRDINSLLPKSKEEYLGTLGVRLTYDQDGTPAIISYGIAAYRPDSSNDYINDELKAEAREAAVSNGNAQIAEIINGRMNAKTNRQTGEEVRTYVEREMKPDSDTVKKTITNIIKITNNAAKSSAKARLQGISTVKTWRFTTKEGHKFVGSVRVWKYSTLEAVSSFNKTKEPKRALAQNKQQFQTFQQESKPVNTMADF